jgi:spore maturation protein CgeB
MMKLLFIGDSWLGSNARSLCDALARQPTVNVTKVLEDSLIPKPSPRWLRALARVARPLYVQRLQRYILSSVDRFQPDCVVAYKGYHLDSSFVRLLRRRGLRMINIYPDCSPHAYGAAHQEAVGAYDLVISAKPFHPPLWQSVYGYGNRCVCVPHGYDSSLHLVRALPDRVPFDVALVATWRREYADLMRTLAGALTTERVSVVIGGYGWQQHREEFPPGWRLVGQVIGPDYVNLIRSARIVIAPVTRSVTVKGISQPGDVETARTYELPAAHCFVVHQRTDYVSTLFDEESEVPMFDNATELAETIKRHLGAPRVRRDMAARAHKRSVPRDSYDARANEIVRLLNPHAA